MPIGFDQCEAAGSSVRRMEFDEPDDESRSLLERCVRFIYANVFRLAINWLLLVLTGRTELERILLATPKSGGQITMEVERLISSGDLPILGDHWTVDDEQQLAAVTVQKYCSETDEKLREHLADTLQRSLAQIRGYWQLCAAVERVRKEKYDVNDVEHEKKLQKLWDLLMPNEDLEARKSVQWQKIGFQGNDPSTDFRGMGVLSLDQLIFMAQYDVAHSQSILSVSNHPLYGFPMAITGITITAMVRKLLHKRQLKQQFYNNVRGAPTISNFHHIFCQIFKLFCAHWMRRKPDSLVYFNEVTEEFEERLIEQLCNEAINIDELCEKQFK